MEKELLMNCDGRIGSNGYCDKCGSKSESSSSYCGRYNVTTIDQIKERISQQPSEQKPPEPKPTTAEEILKNHTMWRVEGVLNAMQEYAILQRNEAIQECIDKVKEFYSHSYLFEELEKLKR